MKLLAYEKTGYYYVNDYALDHNGLRCDKKYCEYFLAFDDNVEVVLYLPDNLPENFDFSETNPLLVQARRRVVDNPLLHGKNCQQLADIYRKHLHYEYGHKDNFPLPKRKKAYTIVPPVNLLELAEFDRQRWMQLTQQKIVSLKKSLKKRGCMPIWSKHENNRRIQSLSVK
jgi:hypothetical protein